MRLERRKLNLSVDRLVSALVKLSNCFVWDRNYHIDQTPENLALLQSMVYAIAQGWLLPQRSNGLLRLNRVNLHNSTVHDPANGETHDKESDNQDRIDIDNSSCSNGGDEIMCV